MSRVADTIIVHKSRRPTVETARDLDRHHRAQGFLKIGYHYFIRRDGTVERGRDLREPGAYSREHNATSVGMCLAIAEGDETPTDDQKIAACALLDQLEVLFPGAKVIGEEILA